ncbi:selenoprotein K-like [Hetaerina americana]|uniref:selenoprotein K-like n=1 Tax=Hetaerina americana TaxID=62018 RepID=UPI003A7F1D00
MVYINSRGEICQSQEWGMSTMTNWFWGALNFVYMFFRTLISPGYNKHGSQYTRDYRPDPRPPRPPQRRMGGFKSMSDCRAPPMMGGG